MESGREAGMFAKPPSPEMFERDRAAQSTSAIDLAMAKAGARPPRNANDYQKLVQKHYDSNLRSIVSSLAQRVDQYLKANGQYVMSMMDSPGQVLADAKKYGLGGDVDHDALWKDAQRRVGEIFGRQVTEGAHEIAGQGGFQPGGQPAPRKDVLAGARQKKGLSPEKAAKGKAAVQNLLQNGVRDPATWKRDLLGIGFTDAEAEAVLDLPAE